MKNFFTAIAVGLLVLTSAPAVAQEVCQTYEMIASDAEANGFVLYETLGPEETAAFKVTVDTVDFVQWVTTEFYTHSTNEDITIVVQYDGNGCLIKMFARPTQEVETFLEKTFGEEV